MKVLFFNMRKVKINLLESAKKKKMKILQQHRQLMFEYNLKR